MFACVTVYPVALLAPLMRGLSLRARDTVATETPSVRAISFIVMGIDFSITYFLGLKVLYLYGAKINKKAF